MLSLYSRILFKWKHILPQITLYAVTIPLSPHSYIKTHLHRDLDCKEIQKIGLQPMDGHYTPGEPGSMLHFLTEVTQKPDRRPAKMSLYEYCSQNIPIKAYS